jgi:predicted house-cleaning noncanonical NTP pyrophosphatase (MazG superfamily)
MVGRLWRDGIPDLIRSQDREPEVRVVERQAYLAGPLEKLLEEAIELRDTPEGRRLEEMGIRSRCSTRWRQSPVTPQEVHDQAARKRKQRGGFGRRRSLEAW